MDNLTLGQVRKAGRFAYNDGCFFVFVPDTGFVKTLEEPEYAEPDDAGVRVATVGEVSEFDDRWSHLPGCDCEFCNE